MDILITHGVSRARTLHVRPYQLGLIAAGLMLALLLLSGTVYHFVFLKAVREGWPVVSQLVRLVVRDETEQRDRFVRENLDAMAQKVGEMQAKLVRLEAVGERVSGLAGVKPEELRSPEAASTPRPAARPGPVGGGRGGPYVPAQALAMPQLQALVDQMDAEAERRADVFTLIESRLLERRLELLLVPSAKPVDGPIGSGFGFRLDPFTGRPALHTGLDFPADVGTPVQAAAGGVVINVEVHPQYGQLLELDHGNGLVTRYAHNSKVLVKPGELIKRGQRVALVGSTGRSTGAHLHFEVLLGGVPQNPARFLARGEGLGPIEKTADLAPGRRANRQKAQ